VGHIVPWSTFFFSGHRFGNKKLKDEFEPMEWWPIVIFWTILFEGWKHRNSHLIPKAHERPIPKTILQILVNFEAFRIFAQEQSSTPIMMVKDKELDIKLKDKNMDLSGATLEDRITHFLAISNNYFPMIEFQDMQPALFKLNSSWIGWS